MHVSVILRLLVLAAPCHAIVWPSSCAGDNGYTSCSCSFVGTFHVPANETSIPQRAFSGCSGINSITGMAGVTSVGWRAFYSSGLTSFHWPMGAQWIQGAAFDFCRSLRTITGLERVTSIGATYYYEVGTHTFATPR